MSLYLARRIGGAANRAAVGPATAYLASCRRGGREHTQRNPPFLRVAPPPPPDEGRRRCSRNILHGCLHTCRNISRRRRRRLPSLSISEAAAFRAASARSLDRPSVRPRPPPLSSLSLLTRARVRASYPQIFRFAEGGDSCAKVKAASTALPEPPRGEGGGAAAAR